MFPAPPLRTPGRPRPLLTPFPTFFVNLILSSEISAVSRRIDTPFLELREGSARTLPPTRVLCPLCKKGYSPAIFQRHGGIKRVSSRFEKSLRFAMNCIFMPRNWVCGSGATSPVLRLLQDDISRRLWSSLGPFHSVYWTIIFAHSILSSPQTLPPSITVGPLAST